MTIFSYSLVYILL